MNRKIKRNFAISLVFLITVLFWLYVEVFLKIESEPEKKITELNSLNTKIVDIIIETDRQLISFALLVIGGIGTLFIQKYTDIKNDSYSVLILVSICCVFALLSIIFGFLLYEGVIEMLSNQMMNSDNSLIRIPRIGQYYSLCISVFSFLLLVLFRIVPEQVNALQRKRKVL
jgi:hypothetical protein